MNKKEKRIAASLVRAWNEFLKLPRYHPDEVADFRSSINRLQDMLAYRVAKRDYPKEWQ